MIDFKSPGEIQQLIDLKLYNDGIDDDTILALCRKVLEYSVHTGMMQQHVTKKLKLSLCDNIGLTINFCGCACF